MKSLREHLQRFIQVRVWGMDIHPSAQIAASALIDRTWPQGIHIAKGCRLDEQSVMLTHDMTRGIYLHTHLGEGCLVGARAIIMPGITIGDGCVIAPGAVVTKDLPPRSYAIGNPARAQPRQK